MAVLNGSDVVLKEGAVGFLSASGDRKSCLTASLLRLDWPLLTDGKLSLECCGSQIFGQSGYPQMRLWPQESEHFLGGRLDLESVAPDQPKLCVLVGAGRFGSFCPEATTLAGL